MNSLNYAQNHPFIANIKDGFNSKTNFLRLMCNIQEVLLNSSSEAQPIINAMNYLRRMNLFHKELFVATFDNVFDIFEKFTSNENMDIVITTFVLLSEIFNQEWAIPQVQYWISYLLPSILDMTTYEYDNQDNEIKQLSLSCLNNIIHKGYYEETLLSLLQGMQNENEAVTLNASKALHTFLTRIDKYYLIQVFDWRNVFLGIIDIYNIKANKKILVEGLINTLRENILGEEDFENVLAKVDDDDVLQSLLFIAPFDYSRVREKRDEEKESAKKIKNN